MMIATECPPADRLRALAHGRLSDEQSDLLIDHVRGCDACRSELETFHDDGDSLIATLRGGDGSAGSDDEEGFDQEPGCRVAVAKALGALARSTDGTTGPLSAALPRTIGEYEVVRPLGRGGMGSVYLARHTKLGRSVALKFLAGHRLAEARMRERFDAEMRAIGRLSHPNVVSAFDAREVDGTAVLVTEYIDGFDLGELVARVGPLSVADGCAIGRRVAEALAYTSGEGFVHRDVKPSNVMLARDGGVTLLDLGLARFQIDGVDPADPEAEPDAPGGATSGGEAIGGVTGTGQTMGTADYIAPEQVTDSRNVDVRADLYALGCTLFKLLTGRAPFADEKHGTAFAKMTAHVSEVPPSLGERLPGAPAALVRLVDSLLAKDPSKRPSSPDLVAKTLAPLAVGSDLGELVAQADRAERGVRFDVSEGKPSGSRQSVWWRRRVPVWGLVAAGLIGVAIGFACGITITIRKPDGSKMTMTVPDGSDIEIDSTGEGEIATREPEPSNAAKADTRKGDLEHQQRLQGVWRMRAKNKIPFGSDPSDGDPSDDSDDPFGSRVGGDPFSSGSAMETAKQDDTRRSGTGIAASLGQMLQADQGYWRVVERRRGGESLEGGITRVVFRGERLYLLDEERIVAEGRMTLAESVSDSNGDELIFRDELHGWSVRVRSPSNNHLDPFGGFDPAPFGHSNVRLLSLVDFEDLSEASVGHLRDVPYDVPQDLYLTKERGSDLAKAEALFRELQSDRDPPAWDNRSSAEEAATDVRARD